MTAAYNSNNDGNDGGVIVVGRENPPSTVIGIKSPKINANNPTYYDFVPPPPPVSKQPKVRDIKLRALKF